MTKFKKVPIDVQIGDLTPLNITCSSTKCEDGLHCFNTGKRAAKKFGITGVCKECGQSLIDWDRIYKNDIRDAKFIFNSMKHELIRHVYWHTKIEKGAIEKARQYSNEELRIKAKKILRGKIGREQNAWDGRQTPKGGNEIVYYAQHATATCCRKCLEYWHNIPKDKVLNNEQLDFCTDLVMYYLEERLAEQPV